MPCVQKKENFDTKMNITLEMNDELKWWVQNLHCQKRVIGHGIQI